jgi:hypothetical protein
LTSTLGKFTIDCFKVLHLASKQTKAMICRKNIFIGRGQYGWLYFAFLSLIYLIVFRKVVQNSRVWKIKSISTKQKQFIELQARLEKSLGQKHLLLFIKA